MYYSLIILVGFPYLNRDRTHSVQSQRFTQRLKRGFRFMIAWLFWAFFIPNIYYRWKVICEGGHFLMTKRRGVSSGLTR